MCINIVDKKLHYCIDLSIYTSLEVSYSLFAVLSGREYHYFDILIIPIITNLHVYITFNRFY